MVGVLVWNWCWTQRHWDGVLSEFLWSPLTNNHSATSPHSFITAS